MSQMPIADVHPVARNNGLKGGVIGFAAGVAVTLFAIDMLAPAVGLAGLLGEGFIIGLGATAGALGGVITGNSQGGIRQRLVMPAPRDVEADCANTHGGNLSPCCSGPACGMPNPSANYGLGVARPSAQIVDLDRKTQVLRSDPTIPAAIPARRPPVPGGPSAL